MQTHCRGSQHLRASLQKTLELRRAARLTDGSPSSPRSRDSVSDSQEVKIVGYRFSGGSESVNPPRLRPPQNTKTDHSLPASGLDSPWHVPRKTCPASDHKDGPAGINDGYETPGGSLGD